MLFLTPDNDFAGNEQVTQPYVRGQPDVTAIGATPFFGSC